MQRIAPMTESLIHALQLADDAASSAFGGLLARHLPTDSAGWLILLQGELGTGKSTIARAMLRGLGQTGPVPSPTYTLIEPYELPAGTVYHVDLYRIGSASELEFLGWEDLDDGLRLVEWPERVPALLQQADVCLRLDYAGDGRRAELHACTPRGREWLLGLSI